MFYTLHRYGSGRGVLRSAPVLARAAIGYVIGGAVFFGLQWAFGSWQSAARASALWLVVVAVFDIGIAVAMRPRDD